MPRNRALSRILADQLRLHLKIRQKNQTQLDHHHTFSTMWLLDTLTLELRDFVGAEIPEKYAILSHTWDIDEVTFRDMHKDREAVKGKAGYVKIQKCCEKARRDGLQYVWIDTCCIDKRSSAELSEAINSMYRWYERSTVCYAYLADVPSEGFWSETADYDALRKSRWFTRGWTLQELLAPSNVLFLGVDWEVIGAKASSFEAALPTPDDRKYTKIFLRKVAEITRIDESALRDSQYVQTAPAALKMSWAAQRETTREEDLAYALMGLFAVSMPILYGEGLGRAFRRLQLEIIQMTTDQSIFVWRANCLEGGLLADSPRAFEDSGLDFVWRNPTLQPYSMTNLGLQVTLPVKSTRDGEEIVLLRCCK